MIDTKLLGLIAMDMLAPRGAVRKQGQVSAIEEFKRREAHWNEKKDWPMWTDNRSWPSPPPTWRIPRYSPRVGGYRAEIFKGRP